MMRGLRAPLVLLTVALAGGLAVQIGRAHV